VALPVNGSKQGVQSSASEHDARDKLLAREATAGKHAGKQRPSLLVRSSVHEAGTNFGSTSAAAGATHSCSVAAAQLSGPKLIAWEAGTQAVGVQRPAPAQHVVNVTGGAAGPGSLPNAQAPDGAPVIGS
jgi:hypothetical protein